MFNTKKKKSKPNPEKLWWFDYLVKFIDGTTEDRNGEVRAIHLANAVDRAQELIDQRVECDPSITRAFMYHIELDEDEEVLP